MKKIFEIKDKKIISEMLHTVEYGTLAICSNNKPYSLPINFVEFNNDIYFHGSKKGKKIDILTDNKYASFSVVEPYSVIPSYFSSNNNLACPATHFFKSIIINGMIEFIDNYDEKIKILTALMKKLQPEGKYEPLYKDIYKKNIDSTAIYKLTANETKAKFKLGQNLNKDRFDLIIEHLDKRGDPKDILTIKLMKEFKNNL